MTERIADIARAREAVARENWAEAYEVLSHIEPSSLEPGDLERLADAAWWLGRIDESFAGRQRAYAGYVAAAEEVLAAGVAIRLAMEHFFREEGALGAGWLARAQRPLREGPETFQHGLLACAESTLARFGGELEGSQALAERAADIGRRLQNPDLIAMGLHLEGLTLIAGGRAADGLALLDEAMTAVVAGELTQYFTGLVYCNVLNACLSLDDLRRAGEWNEASRAWCESLPPESPFPAFCRLNRAELATLTGAWAEAEAEASLALKEVSRVNPGIAGAAVYEMGEILRREGDLVRAEEAFSRAHELGFEPQPGLALVRVAQGKPGPALNALRLALTGAPGDRLRRGRLLAALVEAALAVPDVDAAAGATEELEGIAGEFGTPALAASAATARGSVLLASGDVNEALQSLRTARTTWQQVRMPFEAARTQVLYGVALRAAGDEDDAVLELRAALGTFERLGAAHDAAAASALLGETKELPGGLTQREAEVLRLVAAGRSNRDIAAALVISEHTVARHVQNIFAKLDLSSRSAATAFAFEHGLV